MIANQLPGAPEVDFGVVVRGRTHTSVGSLLLALGARGTWKSQMTTFSMACCVDDGDGTPPTPIAMGMAVRSGVVNKDGSSVGVPATHGSFTLNLRIDGAPVGNASPPGVRLPPPGRGESRLASTAGRVPRSSRGGS